jgi:hypothetical protein
VKITSSGFGCNTPGDFPGGKSGKVQGRGDGYAVSRMLSDVKGATDNPCTVMHYAQTHPSRATRWPLGKSPAVVFDGKLQMVLQFPDGNEDFGGPAMLGGIGDGLS